MLRRGLIPIILLILGLTAQIGVGQNATPSIDALLTQQIGKTPLSLTRVIITFRRKPTSADLMSLKTLGIRGGIALRELPIVLTAINATQFNALRRRSDVASLYANRNFKLFNN